MNFTLNLNEHDEQPKICNSLQPRSAYINFRDSTARDSYTLSLTFGGRDDGMKSQSTTIDINYDFTDVNKINASFTIRATNGSKTSFAKVTDVTGNSELWVVVNYEVVGHNGAPLTRRIIEFANNVISLLGERIAEVDLLAIFGKRDNFISVYNQAVDATRSLAMCDKDNFASDYNQVLNGVRLLNIQ